MADDPRRDFAASVVARLREAGQEAYFAGGCVRDLLLGRAPSDYDVATDARPDRVLGLFRRTLAIGASFGVVKVLAPRGSGLGDVEVATFRSDGAYLDGRRPESVTFSTAEFDASRRDFTINGMFLDPADDRVLDFVGGRADLAAGLLRAIGDPLARFAEDKLRLLRAVRFAARFGLAIEPTTRDAIAAMAGQVTAVSAERIAAEYRRMLADPSRVAAIASASDLGLVAATLPPLAPVAPATLLVLDRLPEPAPLPLALAALLRDVDDASARPVALDLARSLKLPNAERDRLAWLAAHRRALLAPESLPASRLKRLLATEGVADLLSLHRAEAGGEAPHVAYCEHYLATEPDGPIDPPPLVSGNDLIAHGLRPGPNFAAWLDLARDAQLDRTITTRDEALALVDRIAGRSGRVGS